MKILDITEVIGGTNMKELLQRVLEVLHELQETHYELYWDIKTMLDMPVTPVGIVKTIGGYPDESEHIVEWLCKYKDLKQGDFLYILPPKRESLSDDEIYIGFQVDNTNHLNLTSFTAGVRFAEKAHGIGVSNGTRNHA